MYYSPASSATMMRTGRSLRGYLLPASSRAVMRARPQALRGLGSVNPDSATLIANTPISTSVMPVGSPSPQYLPNFYSDEQPSRSPLDYVSPQAAIAAGMDPQTVYDSWTRALAQFGTVNDALAAGIPPGVVTQLFAQSRAYVGNSSGPSLDGQTLLLAAVGLWALFSMKG